MLNSFRSRNSIDFYKKILHASVVIYQPLSLEKFKLVAKFLVIAFYRQSDIKKFSNRMASLKVPVTPQMLGILGWPYLHNEWDINTKFDKIATHYEILSKTFPQLMQIDASKTYEVIDFGDISQGVKVALDFAPWFIREGQLVLNIFKSELRVVSMAFSLGYLGEDKVAYIGVVQGIHRGISSEDSHKIYSQLTKDFEGLRARSLLLEVLKVVLATLGVTKILGISEQHRHQHHSYFSGNKRIVLKSDYNVFWEEHKGIFDQHTGFYSLPMALSIKDISEIQSKKRSMYKRRYEIIEYVRDHINREFNSKETLASASIRREEKDLADVAYKMDSPLGNLSK